MVFRRMSFRPWGRWASYTQFQCKAQRRDLRGYGAAMMAIAVMPLVHMDISALADPDSEHGFVFAQFHPCKFSTDDFVRAHLPAFVKATQSTTEQNSYDLPINGKSTHIAICSYHKDRYTFSISKFSHLNQPLTTGDFRALLGSGTHITDITIDGKPALSITMHQQSYTSIVIIEGMEFGLSSPAPLTDEESGWPRTFVQSVI